TVFHYVEAGYLIAAGGFAANLQAKETRTPILCEADNGLKNLKGTIGMAHHPDHVHSATSQFYINLVDNPSLDFQPNDDGNVNGYCVFGEVIEGMDVVEAIAASAVHDVGEFTNTPVAALVIESIRRFK
ncbi:MAG: peptidyl-prolyl cis-trans isomerase, partial [Planctomycetes bacterium]|nr:peptidyl-prolyl cis-trans isomerase [Planctomycetota bacterium]